MLKMSHLPRKIPDCDLWTRTLASSEYEVCTCPSRADMPRTAGRMGFSGCRSENFDGKAQNQWPGKMAKYICVGAPLLIFVFFGGAPGFRQNGFLKIDKFSLKPLKNVVPNCRGSKTHFGALGSGTSHVRSGSNMVPKYFSLNWHFLSHSPSKWQGELFRFSCLFPFWAQVPFDSFHGCILFCNNNFCNYSFLFCFIFVVFAGCVCFFLLVSLLLILLRHFFSLMTSVFWFFFLFFFFAFAFHVFSSGCLSYPFPVSLPSLVFLSVIHPYLVLMFSFVLCFLFVSRLNLFLLCVFSPCSSSFLIFCVFFSPGPRVHLKRTTMERTTIWAHFVAFRGSLRKCPLRKIILYFFFCGFLSSTEHVFVRYIWNLFWGRKGLFVVVVVVSYLLFYHCFGVWWRAFFLSNLSLAPAFLGFVLFCVRVFSILGASVSLEFCWGLFLFCLSSSSSVAVSSLLCGRAGFSTSCLGCLFLRVGFGAFIFWLTLLGGRSGRANREGSI